MIPDAVTVTITEPGIGSVGLTNHAQERMRERRVTYDDIRERLLADPRKFEALRKLVEVGGVQVTLGRLTFAVDLYGSDLRVLSLWWRGRGPPPRSAKP